MPDHVVLPRLSAGSAPVPSRIEPNWFFGLRTPWTPSDADVWRRTHRSMGRVLFALGLRLVAAAPFVMLPLAPVLGGVGAALALGSLILSYLYWRQRDAPAGTRGTSS